MGPRSSLTTLSPSTGFLFGAPGKPPGNSGPCTQFSSYHREPGPARLGSPCASHMARCRDTRELGPAHLRVCGRAHLRTLRRGQEKKKDEETSSNTKAVETAHAYPRPLATCPARAPASLPDFSSSRLQLRVAKKHCNTGVGCQRAKWHPTACRTSGHASPAIARSLEMNATLPCSNIQWCAQMSHST